MAHESTLTRSHVSGFIRAFRRKTEHNRIFFRICGTRFMLPEKSRFGETIVREAEAKRNVLVLFETQKGKSFPQVLDVFPVPTWGMVSRASRGLPVTYDEFVEVEEGAAS
jgi:hypothetical protein